MRNLVRLLLLVPLCGCDGRADRPRPERADTTRRAAGDVAAAQPELTDPQIASLVALINETEAAAAKAVRPKVVSPAARAFAEGRVADHRALMAAMPTYDGPAVPPRQVHTLRAIFHSQSAMMATLPAGRAFDATFVGIQVADHAMALDSLRAWHGVADGADLRRALAASIPVIAAHLTEARELYRGVDVESARDGALR